MAIEDASRGAARRAASRLYALRDRLKSEINRVIARLETADGKLTNDDLALANAIEAKLSVDEALRDAGLGEVEDALVDAVTDMLVAVADELGAEFSPNSIGAVQRVANDVRVAMQSEWMAASDEIQRAVDIATVSGLELGDLVNVVAQKLDTAAVRAETAINAAIMGAQRAAMLELSEDGGIDLFEYVGPTMGNVRDFCQAHVGKVFSRAFLDREDNGPNQPKPVSVYLGGYNCRHSLAPITREIAEEEGLEIYE